MINQKYLQVASVIILKSDLESLGDAFQSAGLSVIVLKGAALALTVYPNDEYRPMADIDLIVRPNDLSKARTCLENLGYSHKPEPASQDGPFQSEQTGEVSYVRKNHASIDLHWEFTSMEWLRNLISINEDEWWANASPLPLANKRLNSLAPVDMISYLCLHLVSHHFSHPYGFRDIENVLKKYNPFPWDVFLIKVTAARLKTSCYFVLNQIASRGNVEIPVEILDRLRPPYWQIKLVTFIADPNLASQGKIKITVERQYLLHITVADRFIDVVRVIFWLLFPGPIWLNKRYYRKHLFLRLTAVFWHPLSVLLRGIKGAITVISKNPNR